MTNFSDSPKQLHVIWSGKGCSTVLIPERVVQALQLHFEHIAATSGPKPPAFPPLHGINFL